MASSFPPSFFDRATGGVMGGTPTPVGARIVIGPGGTPTDSIFQELPNSPQIEFSEQGTVKHSWKVDYATILSLLPGLKRGIILQDSFGNFSRILSTNVEYDRGDCPILSVTAESLMTADVPPDEFGIEPIEFNPALEKNPRYFIYDPAQTPPYIILTPFDVFLVKSGIGASNFITLDTFNKIVSSIPNPADPNTSQTTASKRKAAASELLQKMLQGIEAPYIPAFRVTWSQYFFYGAASLGPGGNVNPHLNPGGFLQDPTTVIVPSFWSWDGSGTADTNILLPASLGGAMDDSLSPTFYSRGISWLREADSIYYQRTWFKITSMWLGAPVGQWDKDIYSSAPSPYLP